jgi:Uma2 family endonuclease
MCQRKSARHQGGADPEARYTRIVLAPDRKRMSEAEYLRYDAADAVRNEWVNGEVVAMAGGHPAHVEVVAALLGALRSRLAGGACRALASDLRVRVTETGLHAYPDIVIFCGTPEYAPTTPPTLLNPAVLIEVLSESTEAFDRGAKASHYRRRASVQEIVLVSWTERRIEVHSRDGTDWRLTDVYEDGVLHLPSLGIDVPVSEVFAGVQGVL